MNFHKENPPKVIINGNIGFISQKPWIINDTVRNNILFGKEFNQKAYKATIKFACLEQDLKILPKHDMTEIGKTNNLISVFIYLSSSYLNLDKKNLTCFEIFLSKSIQLT